MVSVFAAQQNRRSISEMDFAILIAGARKRDRDPATFWTAMTRQERAATKGLGYSRPAFRSQHDAAQVFQQTYNLSFRYF
jgi:hypothetical protein